MSLSRGTGGEKILLPRKKEKLWAEIETHYAGDDQRRWLLLGMLHLHTYCGWNLRMLGLVAGLHKGQVCRLLKEARAELAEQFQVSLPDASANDVDEDDAGE